MSFGIMLILGYLLGSIPFGLVIALFFCGRDPRKAGSKNVGATNIARVCGKKWGLLTLVCDIAKAVLPVLVTKYALNEPLLAGYVGLGVILGHMFSVFLGFKGGKGVATAVGVWFSLAFLQTLVAGIVFVCFFWRTSYVSLSSLAMVTTLPIVLFLTQHYHYAFIATLVMGLIYWAHRTNIHRLRTHTETKLR